MSERQEKLAIAAAKSTGGRARASLEHLQRRWGRLHRKPELAIGDRVFLETMDAPELWRVTGVVDGVWLEQEDVMTHLRVIQGQGKPERPCLFCGEKWDGEDDQNHGAHNRQAECSHMGIFNCQLKMIGSYCDCPPSGPAYPRQPHEAKYEMDTAGNLRKVEAPAPTTAPSAAADPALPRAATAPAGGFDSGIIQLEPTDHREEVGGFKRGEPCAFQHRFRSDGTCAACPAKVPEGCTCAPTGTETTGYVHAQSCKLSKPAPAPPAPATDGGDQLAWVKVDADGFSCERCGLWATIPDDPTLAADALATFEGEHLFCPEKSG